MRRNRAQARAFSQERAESFGIHRLERQRCLILAKTCAEVSVKQVIHAGPGILKNMIVYKVGPAFTGAGRHTLSTDRLPRQGITRMFQDGPNRPKLHHQKEGYAVAWAT